MYKLLAISGLTLALMSGTAIAQVSVGTNGNAGVSVGATVGNTSANVGVNAGVAGSGNTSSDATNAGANANADATVGVNSGNSSASGTAATGTAASTASDSTSASGSTSAQAAIDALGDQGSGFFSDSGRTTANSQDQIQATFSAMSTADQEQMRAACKGAEASDASASGKVCMAINAM